MESVFLVVAKEYRRTRRGTLFIRLMAADSSGQIEANIWHNAKRTGSEFEVGNAVEIAGVTRIYRNGLYIDVEKIRRRHLDTLSVADRPRLDVEMLVPAKEAEQDGAWVLTSESEAAQSERARMATERKMNAIVARLSGERNQVQGPEKEDAAAFSSTVKDDPRIAAIIKKYSRPHPEEF